MDPQAITVETIVHAPIEKVWECWNAPEHISAWAFASDDWEASGVENNLREGGTFKTIMGAKDKSTSFDFTGTYTTVQEHELIEYSMADGRQVRIKFAKIPEGIKITETFDPENENSQEVQKAGWQAILDNFKRYVEGM